MSTARGTTTVGAGPATSEPDEVRRVKLTLNRIDPFSVMKVSFLVSVALGIAGVVVIAVLWTMLNGMGVFTSINDAFNDLRTTGANTQFNVMDYLGFGRVLSLSVVFGVVDVILMTAMATVMAFIYNICAALVGGIGVTLSDD